MGGTAAGAVRGTIAGRRARGRARLAARGALAAVVGAIVAAVVALAVLDGCAPAISPWALPAEDVDAALEARRAVLDDPEEGPTAALEAGWIALLRRNDLEGSLALLERAPAAEPLTRLGRAIAAHERGDATAAADAWLTLLAEGPVPLRRLAALRLGDLADQAPIAERVLAAARAIGEPGDGALALDVSRLRGAMARRLGQGEPRPSLPVAVVGPLPVSPVSGFRESLTTLEALKARERSLDALDGVVLLHPQEKGLFLVHLALPPRGQVVLRVETRAAVRAFLRTGEEPPREVLLRDRYAASAPRTLDVTLDGPRTGLTLVVAADRPGQTVVVRAARTDADREELRVPEVVRSLVDGWLAEQAGDVSGVLAAADTLAARAPESALVPMMRARAAQADETLPREVAATGAREAMEQALAACPDLVAARAGLVRLLRDAGAPTEARALVEQGRARQPDVLRWDVAIAELDAEAGWEADAERSLRGVLARHPGCCPARASLAELLWERPAAVDALLESPPGAAACDRTRDMPLRAALRRGDGARAVPLAEAELARTPEDETAFQSLTKALLVAERPLDARRLLQERAARFGPSAAWRFQEAEAAALAGDATAARDAWRTLVTTPGGDAELRHRLALLGFGELWARLAVDGRTLAADFRTLPGEADAAAVWLLDDTISVWWPDGGAAHRVHSVVKLLTETAATELGEVSVPPGAEILEVRTLKADGTVLEPEDIIEKDTVSLPNLEVGDFIEVVTVRFEDPDDRFAPGRPAESFLFRSFDGPVRRARFLIVLQQGQEPIATVQGEGIRTLTPIDWPGWRVVGWEALHQPQVHREPLALEPEARLPQVRAALAVSWEDVRRAWRDQIAVRLQQSRAMTTFVDEAGGARGPLRDRAEALFRAVHLRVASEEGAGFLLDPATYVLARGRGERVMLLRAALQAAGVPCRVLLVHPLDRDGAAPRDVPGLLRYTWPVIAADVEGGTVWMDPTLEGVPFDYLAPTLQGRPALDLEPRDAADGAEEITPRWPLDVERRTIRQTVTLEADGTAVGTGQETIRGIAAVSYRTYLAPAEPDKRREVLQVLLRAAFPGATLTELTIEGLDDPQGPLRLRYRFEVSLGGGGRDGNGGAPREVGFAVAPEGLSRAYLPLGDRTTPFLFDGHYDVDAEVRLVLPRGARATTLPPTARYEDAFGAYSLDVRQDEQDGRAVLTLQKRWQMPMTIVTPEQYRDFTAAAGRIDRADRVRVTLSEQRD